MKWVAMLLGVMLMGCKKHQAEPTPSPVSNRPVPLGEIEIKRNDDACADYAAKICACASKNPDDKTVAELCKLDRALPEALRISLEISLHPDTKTEDVVSAQRQTRKIAAQCIEGVGKLPTLGCR
jgi:hypothetical protein